MLSIHPIPALHDNYIWCIRNQQHCLIVDPGAAAPVSHYLQQHQLSLNGILITHHHNDHIGGVAELLVHHTVPIYASHHAQLPFQTHACQEGDFIDFPLLNLNFAILDIPGHTLDHIAFYNNSMIFCGDTLFSAGCGRLFEGTATQLFTSLQKIAHLPPDTAIYCAHEYTEKNLAFAAHMEPDNRAITHYLEQVQTLRAAKHPSLPSTLALELQINPFLRTDNPTLRQQLQHLGYSDVTTDIDVFTLLRTLKNSF